MKLNKARKLKLLELTVASTALCFVSFILRHIFPLTISNEGISLGVNLGSYNLIIPGIIILILFSLFLYVKSRALYLGILAVIAGGICNLFEKVAWGKVFDYINFFDLWYFNIADLVIFGGVCLIIYEQLWNQKK